MPDLARKSTLPPLPTCAIGSTLPPPMPPLPPIIPTDPSFASEWESFEGFRFTFLRHFPRPEDSTALQAVAQLLYDLILESPRGPQLDPPTRWELVAALAELRFLEGYLTSVFLEHKVSSLPPEVEALSRFAGGIAEDVARVARRLNEELAKWRDG